MADNTTRKNNGRRFSDEIKREAASYVRTLHATMADPSHRRGFDRTANDLMNQITADFAASGTFDDLRDGKAVWNEFFCRAYAHRPRYRGRPNGLPR